ncbi:MAG: helix-turn-helix transcriptional regulator [Acetobacteraceae bacterium]
MAQTAHIDGEAIRKWINQACFCSQAEFAECVGLDGLKLTKILSGERRLQMDELARMAAALHRAPSEIAAAFGVDLTASAQAIDADVRAVRRYAYNQMIGVLGHKVWREEPDYFLARVDQLASYLLSGTIRPVSVHDGDDLAQKRDSGVAIEGGVCSIAVDFDAADLIEKGEDQCLAVQALGHDDLSVAGVATATVGQAGDVSNGAAGEGAGR